jgi:hypothetical protein
MSQLAFPLHPRFYEFKTLRDSDVEKRASVDPQQGQPGKWQIIDEAIRMFGYGLAIVAVEVSCVGQGM